MSRDWEFCGACFRDDRSQNLRVELWDKSESGVRPAAVEDDFDDVDPAACEFTHRRSPLIELGNLPGGELDYGIVPLQQRSGRMATWRCDNRTGCEDPGTRAAPAVDRASEFHYPWIRIAEIPDTRDPIAQEFVQKLVHCRVGLHRV